MLAKGLAAFDACAGNTVFDTTVLQVVSTALIVVAFVSVQLAQV
jgi:hypothetical protein